MIQRGRKWSYLGCCVVNNLLGGQVTLVAYQELVDIFNGVLVNLLKPLLHIVERLLQRTAEAISGFIHCLSGGTTRM